MDFPSGRRGPCFAQIFPAGGGAQIFLVISVLWRETRFGYDFNRYEEAHAKTQRSKDTKDFLSVFASLRLCVNVFLFRLRGPAKRLTTLMSRLVFSDLSDQELIELSLKRGAKDNRPFSELFRRHHAVVWRVCYRFMTNSQDAEDMTQEVFFKAYRKLSQFEGRSSLSTWLYRIAVTTCLNEKRRRSRRPALSSTPLDDMIESLPAESSEEECLTQIQQGRLIEALAQLRETQRQVLFLRDFEQLSYKEIAQRLGLSLSATKMRIQRARLALQSIYRQLE